MIVSGLPQSAATGSSTSATGTDVGSWAATMVSFCNVSATVADAEARGKGEQGGGLVGGLVGKPAGEPVGGAETSGRGDATVE